jgi:hypothetical protein
LNQRAKERLSLRRLLPDREKGLCNREKLSQDVVARYKKKAYPTLFVPPSLRGSKNRRRFTISILLLFHFGYYNLLFGYFIPEPATEFCFALNNNICKQFLLPAPPQAWEK